MTALALGALPACAVPEAMAQPTATAARAAATTGQVHHIALQGAVNVRDLGGYRTEWGRQVRYGRVFRADALSRLTDGDVSKLSGLRLRTVVDFRLSPEVRRDGADRVPEGVTVVSRPVDDLGLYARTTEVIGSKDPVAQEAALGDGRAERMMRSIYRTFVTDADSRRQFAAVVRDVAHTKGTPLLFHCTSGKDRTGWMSYLLLRAVGVPARAAERDFLLSNTFRREADREVREGLRESGYMRDPGLLIPLQEVREDYLEAALEQVEEDYGSLRGYLTEGLGLDTRTLMLLRARLLR
ncbi:tyrosine-protein phosphatase [Streptomyces sp. AC602_WCS936]|uniref:tyrosine-protein phosphatase n=1 Tax=Streptomyces sp. AC602_WCS936 TaxID=2823685 RepID=UPI0027E3BEDD|nr:tyrosine-protein phosphatase [Streptomyces sp. AC602_WCS936]